MSYPAPPWQTHGWAIFAPMLVRAEDVRVPAGLTVESKAGFTVGLFGLVDYRAPSPLEYRELVWMPARVRARRADGRVARGYYVAKMYVDHAGSLAAGREVWALPKQRARFEIGEREALVTTEDGARVVIACGRRGPSLPGKSAVVTLQTRGSELVRFRGDMRGRVSPRRVRIASLAGLDGTWQGLSNAIPLGPLGAELASFRTVMRPPEVFPLR